MVAFDLPKQPTETVEPGRYTMRQRLRIAGVVLVCLLVGIPVALAGGVYLFWDDIDRQIQQITSQPGEMEPHELNGAELNRFLRKMKAVQLTLEKEPFVTFTVEELNSAIANWMNMGTMPPSIHVLRFDRDKDLLKARTMWHGEELSTMLQSWGLSASNPVYGPMVTYIRKLKYFQFELWLRPRAEKGKLTWDVEQARVDDWAIPLDLARWLQDNVLKGPAQFAVGDPSRALKEARVTQHGLLLKWMPPAT